MWGRHRPPAPSLLLPCPLRLGAGRHPRSTRDSNARRFTYLTGSRTVEAKPGIPVQQTSRAGDAVLVVADWPGSSRPLDAAFVVLGATLFLDIDQRATLTVD